MSATTENDIPCRLTDLSNSGRLNAAGLVSKHGKANARVRYCLIESTPMKIRQGTTTHLLAQWGKLTDNHLDVIAGKRIALSGQIQEVYGVSLAAA